MRPTPMSPPGNASAVRLAMVTVDCVQPRKMAAFWSQVLGWHIVHDEDTFAVVAGDREAAALGFGRVEGWAPPSWPDHDGIKQFHLDLSVDDLDAAEQRCVSLGAVRADPQPQPDRWRVLLDPDGHPFCLTPAALLQAGLSV